MSFDVDTTALRSVADDLHAMAAAIPSALTYAETHVRAPTGGVTFDNIVAELDRAREDLRAAYAPDGPVQSYLQGAGDALAANADDYDATDVAQRATFDALLGQIATPVDPAEAFDPAGETAGITTAELTAELAEPGDFFEGLDVWHDILDNTSYVVSLTWAIDALLQIPLFAHMPDPTQSLRDTFDGDWTTIGTAALSLAELKDFFERAEAEVAASVLAVQPSWSGNAADAAFASFAGFCEVLASHQSDLGRTSQGFNGFAMGMRMLTDALCSLIDWLFGVFIEWIGFDPADILQAIRRGSSQILKWVTAVAKAIDLIFLIIDLLFALVAVFPLTLGQINTYPGLAIPQGEATTFTPSDVDGP